MRRIFQKWLMLFIAIGFCVTFLFSFGIQTWMARSHAETLLLLKVGDVKNQLLANQHSIKILKEECRQTALGKAKTFAFLLKMKPEAAQNTEMLQVMAAILMVDHLHVVDQTGMVVGSSVPEHLDEDLNCHDQMQYFLPLLTDPSLELVRETHPLYAENGTCQFAAVARLDAPGFVQIGYSPRQVARAMEISSLRNLAGGFRVGSDGRVIIGRHGVIVSVEDTHWLHRSMAEYGVPPMLLAAAPNGTFTARVQNEKSLCVYKKIQDYHIVGILPENEIFAARNVIGRQLVLYNLVLFAMIFILVSTLVQNVVINGIYNVNQSLQKITGGDETELVQVETNEEFRLLSQGINETVAALKKARSDAARRLDAELFFARAIQQASLPQTFPPFPGRVEFDIFAAMVPAREVGGDFYDFFLINQNSLALVIADVSGKGVPAALFMMKAKTLIKNDAELGHAVAEVLTNANLELCENNDAGMFVTVFLAVLDLTSGRLRYANAGHNPPWLQRANGEFAELAVEPGFVLGGLEEMTYEEQELQLSPGDMLFLYTDGIPEAMNLSGEWFGRERLQKCLRQAPVACAPAELLEMVEQQVRGFSEGAEAADDRTMLAMTYWGSNVAARTTKEIKSEITVPAKERELTRVIDFVKQKIASCDCNRKVASQLELAVEEIFTNIAKYAYQPAEGEVTVRGEVDTAAKQLTLQFIDAGRKFNPLRYQDPNIDAILEEREVGGLGIFLTKKCMDELQYEYQNGKNILTVKKKLSKKCQEV